MTVVIYTLMAVLSMLILAFAWVFVFSQKWPQLAQTGDCTLGPRSVNWMAAIPSVGRLNSSPAPACLWVDNVRLYKTAPA